MSISYWDSPLFKISFDKKIVYNMSDSNRRNNRNNRNNRGRGRGRGRGRRRQWRGASRGNRDELERRINSATFSMCPRDEIRSRTEDAHMVSIFESNTRREPVSLHSLVNTYNSSMH